MNSQSSSLKIPCDEITSVIPHTNKPVLHTELFKPLVTSSSTGGTWQPLGERSSTNGICSNHGRAAGEHMKVRDPPSAIATGAHSTGLLVTCWPRDFTSSQRLLFECHSVSVPQYTSLYTHLHSKVFSVINHWSGLRSLASNTLSILGLQEDSSQISCCCSVSWRSCSFGSIVLVSSHTPTVHPWVRCWGRPTLNPGSGPERYLNWSALLLSNPWHWLTSNPWKQGQLYPVALVGASPSLEYCSL